jgi:hypothetical protein
MSEEFAKWFHENVLTIAALPGVISLALTSAYYYFTEVPTDIEALYSDKKVEDGVQEV